ncbi:MAG: hypothetical protein Q8M83_03930 [bacterium]|nr:hypothetical protein [bacterium]
MAQLSHILKIKKKLSTEGNILFFLNNILGIAYAPYPTPHPRGEKSYVRTGVMT